MKAYEILHLCLLFIRKELVYRPSMIYLYISLTQSQQKIRIVVEHTLPKGLGETGHVHDHKCIHRRIYCNRVLCRLETNVKKNLNFISILHKKKVIINHTEI